MVTHNQSQSLDLGLDISEAHIPSRRHAVPSSFASLAHIGRKYQVEFLNLELGKSGQEVQQI